MDQNPALQSAAEAPFSPAERITRGLCRYLWSLNHATLCEFRLTNSRRADVVALTAEGRILIVEVKSGPADFRSDGKWHEYLPYCDGFAFAVDTTFPLDLLPSDVGAFVTDGWDVAAIRPWSGEPLHAARRRAMTLRFARTAALRLSGRMDEPQ